LVDVLYRLSDLSSLGSPTHCFSQNMFLAMSCLFTLFLAPARRWHRP
jgi:hypothetical protein